MNLSLSAHALCLCFCVDQNHIRYSVDWINHFGMENGVDVAGITGLRTGEKADFSNNQGLHHGLTFTVGQGISSALCRSNARLFNFLTSLLSPTRYRARALGYKWRVWQRQCCGAAESDSSVQLAASFPG